MKYQNSIRVVHYPFGRTELKKQSNINIVRLIARPENSKSFIFESEFVFFSEEKLNLSSDPNMKLLLSTERTLR